ncbi:MAG TPA: hypothetical protein VLX61_03155 [Anaerolineales bacterium]|nr:hypothetical protein [Anaerolineales bacterium]
MKSQQSSRFVWAVLMLVLTIVACTATGRPASAPTANSSPPTSVGPSPAAQGVSPADLPSVRLDQASDINSSSMATAKGVSGGDVFVQGLYERPFNANTMDTYFPYIDIIDTQGFKDDNWGYATITMAGTDKDGHLSAEYAVELDLNKDGRGDWLVRASHPSSTTWTTQGVQAWKDSNGDIGGAIPMVADNKPSGGDGYETLVFDEGKGNLPDGAWARISPDDPKTVQIAFKLSMLGDPTSFAMGAWAGANIDPSMFDHNDHMTHVQAGDPNQGYPQVYPIKALAEIDNTCRLAIGFVPTGTVPGLCAAPQIQHNASQCPPGQSYTCYTGAALICGCH